MLLSRCCPAIPLLGGSTGNRVFTPLNFGLSQHPWQRILLIEERARLKSKMIKRDSSHGRHAAACIVVLLAACLLSGCETASKLGEGFGNMGDKALETIGFKKPEIPKAPELPESAKPARRLKLRFAASDSLNVDAAGRSLSLVVRVYKLRSPTAFLNAPYETFGNGNKEKTDLADELIEAREIVLLPGQPQEINERWAREASYVGIVALFRAPAPQRWRYAFELENAPSDTGLVVGAHASTLSIAAGDPVSVSSAALKFNSTACAVR
jgi:type VI secretion system protein VasD